MGSRKCNKIDVKFEVILKVQNYFLVQLLVRHKINHYFNCDGKCLVYLITNRTCELQYLGQICEVFRKQ